MTAAMTVQEFCDDILRRHPTPQRWRIIRTRRMFPSRPLQIEIYGEHWFSGLPLGVWPTGELTEEAEQRLYFEIAARFPFPHPLAKAA